MLEKECFNTAIHSVKDTFQTTLLLQTESLQSRARDKTVTEKITEAGDKAGVAANEMSKEEDILRGFNVQENSYEKGCWLQEKNILEGRNALVEN